MLRHGVSFHQDLVYWFIVQGINIEAGINFIPPSLAFYILQCLLNSILWSFAIEVDRKLFFPNTMFLG